MKETKNEIIDNHLERFNNFEAVMDLLCSIIAEIKNLLSADDIEALQNQKKLRTLQQSLESVLQKKLSVEEQVFLKGFVMKYVLLCEDLLK